LERTSAKAALVDQIRELRNMAASAGKMTGGWGQAMTNSAFDKRVKSLHSGIVANYVRAMSGATTTNEERESLAARLPLNYITQNDGDQFVREGLSDFLSEAALQTNAEISQVATDVLPGSPEHGMRGGSPTWANAEDTEADVLRGGRGEEKTRTQSAMESLRSPKNASGTIRPTALWTQVGNPTTKEGRSTPGDDENVSVEERIPQWAPAMEDIFKTAVESKKTWGSKGTEPSADNIEAYRVLQKLKLDDDPAKADYANDLLKLIDTTTEKSGRRKFSLTDLLDD
jgi:hypothetical protein